MDKVSVRENEERARAIWSDILEILKTRLPESSFNTWFVKTVGIGYTGDRLIVEAPNTFWIEWIESNYRRIINEVLRELSKNLNVVFTPKTNEIEDSFDEQPSSRRMILSPKYPLNPRFTFESFIVGKSNEMAYHAATRVAQNPGQEYNPLFIYGGVGLGKTHLLNAIGNFIYSKGSKIRAALIRCEDLMNELIDSLQRKKMREFREKFRSVDILLIDDIQFLQDKSILQEELFHTFNYLFEKQKQIVMTSDRSPQQIYALEERLVSRFQWGLVTEIGKPDFETRLAITKRKTEEEKIVLSEEIIIFIAENIKDNVRSIEGAIKILKAYMSLTKNLVSIEKAKELLANFIKPTTNITMQEVLRVVAQEFKLTPYDLKSKTRKKEVVLARQIAMYIARNVIGLSLSTIGSYFGGKDHTTVLHSIQKIEQMKEDPKIELLLSEINRKLKLI